MRWETGAFSLSQGDGIIMTDIKKEIDELTEKLNHYRDQYYNNSISEISDFEYDQLFDLLKSKEEQSGYYNVNSPVHSVGYSTSSSLTKVKHSHPMLSLDKTKDPKDVVKFVGNTPSIVMAKMDGLTCSVHYKNGKLISAETRGDGMVGEDVTACAKTIKNLPKQISNKADIVIDGEVIISYKDFSAINSSLPASQQYSNPRNLAAGSIRQLDPKIASTRKMQFVAWRFVKGSASDSFSQRRLEMISLGFTVVPQLCAVNKITEESFVKSVDLIKRWCEEQSYPIDGCVIGYDSVSYGEKLGATEHHLRSQLAYKFYDEVYESKLLNIEWGCGKTGILTPTAVFEPVEIDGSIISRASLSNISILRKTLGSPFVGQTIFVSKRNAVIPKIESAHNERERL